VRADDPDLIEVEGPPPLERPAELVIEALSPVVTAERLQRISDVVRARTDDLVLVLDRISDPHNSSAVLRSADAFGLQTVHVIVGQDGYSIYVASMAGDKPLEELRAMERLAVVFGNEHRGVSQEMEALADGTFSIPMRGFVESLNISVAAAITIQALARDGRRSLPVARQRELEARFLMNSVRNADQVIDQYSRE
jgi:tRNA (guanosine-2'-O-)-methyltransferase